MMMNNMIESYLKKMLVLKHCELARYNSNLTLKMLEEYFHNIILKQHVFYTVHEMAVLIFNINFNKVYEYHSNIAIINKDIKLIHFSDF